MRYAWVLIPGLCLALYGRSLHRDFYYDSEHSIEKNIYIRSLEKIPAFFKDPAMFSVDADKAMYRPLLLVSYALNFHFGGFDARGYHLVNILLHAINACLLCWLGLLLCGRRGPGLAAGLLFALHPLSSEPVHYISSRSESLAALFYLLSFCLFARAEQRGDGRLRWASWTALALGLLSKSTVITLPAVLLAFDYLLISRRQWSAMRPALWRRHGPYWLLAATYVQVIVGNRFLTRSLEAHVRGPWVQFLTQVKAFPYYVRLLIWPLELNIEHQFWEQKLFVAGQVLAPLLLLAAFVCLLVYLYRRRCERGLLLNVWALAALLPVMVVPLNVLVNERRLYLPCAAFCLGLALMLDRGRMRRARVAGQRVGHLVLLALLLVYGSLSAGRSRVWADGLSLWQDAVAGAPLMPRNYLYLGNAYQELAQRTADPQRALQHWRHAAGAYEAATRLKSNPEIRLRALNNLGGVYFVLGARYGVPEFIDKAEEAYRKSVRQDPQYVDALVNLGNIYLLRSRQTQDAAARDAKLAAAYGYYRRALGKSPNHYEAHVNLAMVLADQGQYQKAVQIYQRALFLNPKGEIAMNNLAGVYRTLAEQALQQGKKKEARHLLQQARQFLQRAIQVNSAYQNPRQGLERVDSLLQRVR